MAKEQTTVSRCFPDTPCQLPELPGIWHCLDLLRSGTAAASLETAHLSPHLSFSIPRLTGQQGLASFLLKKMLHIPYQALSAIFRLTTPKKPSLLRRHLYPQQNPMSVPRRDLHYIQEASNLPTLPRRCWQEECFSAWRRLWHEHHACWFPNMDHSPMDLNPHAHSLIMFLTWCKTRFSLFTPLTGY